MIDRPEHLRHNVTVLKEAEDLIRDLLITDRHDSKYGFPLAERQALIDALHAAGMKVYYMIERSIDHD